MTDLITLIAILSILLLGVSLSAWYRYIGQKNEVKTRLKEANDSENQELEKKQSLLHKIFAKILTFADDFSEIGERFNFFSETEDVEKWLIQADNPYDLTVKRFQGLKIALTLIGFFTGVLAFLIGLPFRQFLVVILPFIGFFGPIFWIKNKAKKRQEELSYALPDFLDMVSVTLKAGASLDQAFREISRYFDGPIQEEFSRFNHRANLGIQREELYLELINRTDVPEFHTVIKSLIRGAELGVPVATTFEIQSAEIRQLRKEKAKELAAKASPKITLITTFVVMPTAFILIGGLLLLNIIYEVLDSGIFE
ncbi:tight adherence protein C [Gracilibacillus ureilyticus]|uniref:Tight adherence protein C n=1 Tax=Gracilibacillus ureilyticus TaxID=531814 RepID=A0A1H9VJA1_9BACI|nr:type II secretion system F family protein [Gracilibacillus ureilyticus]SES21581.1 tight adherence protein C [Gracilibacillus ureilyticus]